MVHLIADNEIYWEYAFGASRQPVMAWLETASDNDLLELGPSHLGGEKTAGEVVPILLDEQTHHGAEIALLRDLYLRPETRTAIP